MRIIAEQLTPQVTVRPCTWKKATVKGGTVSEFVRSLSTLVNVKERKSVLSPSMSPSPCTPSEKPQVLLNKVLIFE